LAAALLIAIIPLLLITVAFGFPHGLANYWHGVTLIHADANPHWEAFLWGQYSASGFWYYYLLAQLWKTPLPTLLCFAAALFLVGRDERARPLDWLFLLLPLAAFHAAGMWQRASIGVRHVLPAFPFLMLACGATARWVARQGRTVHVGFAALCLWLLAGTLRVYPHFLPYFNELAGGPAGGAFYLDDSNIEWGQAFYTLAGWLERHPSAQVRLLAFEPLDHEVYGIRADPMRLRDVVWPEPGVTYLAGTSYLQRSSLFNDRPGLRSEWLERYRPVDQIGWSIDVFRFSNDPADAGRDDVIYLPRERWYADAVERLSSIVNRWPDFTLARDTLADVYADRAGWHEQQGQAEAAILDAWRAAALASGGRHKTAFRDAVLRLAPAISSDGVPVEAAFRAAAAACSEGATGDCVLALLRTVNQSPRHLPACLNLGSVYAQAGYPQLATREWERCLAVDPTYAPARENLTRLHQRRAMSNEQ
jgi:tetratricopeptide (TPR) repeat protein